MATYTQHSVAWPTLPLREEWWTDELLLDDLEGGAGGSGEATIAFMVLGGKPAVHVGFFMESYAAVRSLLPVLDELTDETTPAEVIALLEAHGWEASEYHKAKAATA